MLHWILLSYSEISTEMRYTVEKMQGDGLCIFTFTLTYLLAHVLFSFSEISTELRYTVPLSIFMLGWKHQFFWSRALDKFLSVHTGTTGTSIAFPTANRATRLSCKTVRRLGVSGKLLHRHRSFLDRLLSQYRVTFLWLWCLHIYQRFKLLEFSFKMISALLTQTRTCEANSQSWHSFTFLEVCFYSWDMFVSWVTQNAVFQSFYVFPFFQ